MSTVLENELPRDLKPSSLLNFNVSVALPYPKCTEYRLFLVATVLIAVNTRS